MFPRFVASRAIFPRSVRCYGDGTMNRVLVVRTVSVALALAIAGCRRPPTPEAVERAPFEVVDGGALRVRDDLVGTIKTVEARASADDARLEGFGHVGFAPGASCETPPSWGHPIAKVMGPGEVTNDRR